MYLEQQEDQSELGLLEAGAEAKLNIGDVVLYRQPFTYPL